MAKAEHLAERRARYRSAFAVLLVWWVNELVEWDPAVASQLSPKLRAKLRAPAARWHETGVTKRALEERAAAVREQISYATGSAALRRALGDYYTRRTSP